MELKHLSRKLVIAGTLIIWAIKFVIRPGHIAGQYMDFFWGIAPNLLGSFLIPFGAYWFFSGKNFLLARIFQIESAYDVRLVCALGFGMLVVNEYLQLISVFGRTFDYNDILFSAVGLTVSNFVFSKILQRYQVQTS
jgi:hypothetical protein